MNQADEELVNLLRQNDLKATPQRLAIFRFLSGNDSHPSADMILNQIRKELPSISPGTVYKTLSVLTDIGAIRELKMRDGFSRYDSNIDVHVNIICPKCNNITDYESDEVQNFYNQISADIDGEISGQRFDVYRPCLDTAACTKLQQAQHQ